METAPTARHPGPPRPVRSDPPAPGGGTLVLGRYRLLRRLGAGGFGAVWLAHDGHLDREVAVKAIPRMPEAQPRARRADRAQREALAAARLNHPAVVTLYEAGADADFHYLISEVVAGRTLAELIAAGGLSDRDVAVIGVALAGALAHAHGRGVIHRDVKPQNVMVPDAPAQPEGVAKLTDFGVAHLVGDEPLTRTGDVVGTLAYMAPEQAEGRRVGAPADLYALALALFEALAGAHPVRGRGPAATARRLGAPLPSLGRWRRDLPASLVSAIDRALAPDPRDRGSLADLRSALEAAAGDLSDEGGRLARTLGPRPRLRIPARLLSAAAAAGLVAAASALTAPPAASLAAIAAIAGAGVLVLPRAGWLAAALAVITWVLLGPAAQPGAALLLAAGLAACPVLLPRAGRLWSLPAAAPALGLLGLAAAYPALAGLQARLGRRAALGALGAWWLVLAEPLLDTRLHLRDPPAGHGWRSSPLDAGADVLWPLLRDGGLALAAAWALAACVLPWLVRGRSLAADLVGGAAWAAALAAAGSAAAGGDARGAGIGALVALAVALAARWWWPSPPAA